MFNKSLAYQSPKNVSRSLVIIWALMRTRLSQEGFQWPQLHHMQNNQNCSSQSHSNGSKSNEIASWKMNWFYRWKKKLFTVDLPALGPYFTYGETKSKHSDSGVTWMSIGTEIIHVRPKHKKYKAMYNLRAWSNFIPFFRGILNLLRCFCYCRASVTGTGRAITTPDLPSYTCLGLH